MIAKFLTSSENEEGISINIGEVSAKNLVPIWAEIAYDDASYTQIDLCIGDLDQMIELLKDRRREMVK